MELQFSLKSQIKFVCARGDRDPTMFSSQKTKPGNKLYE